MRAWHWAMAVLLSVGLVACGSGASGFGPPPGGGSGTQATAQVTVVDTVTDPHPLPNVRVVAEGEPASTLTDLDGRATITVPTGHTSRLLLQFPVGSQHIYPLTVPAGQPAVEVTLFADPLAATTTTPGVTIMPTVQAPAGIARIMEPQDGATMPCAPLPAVCSFDVHGQASTVLGHPETPFVVHVAVTPLGPSEEGTTLHFPPVRVDPVTGRWHTVAYLDGAGTAAVQPGARWQIVAVVTSARLSPETTTEPLRFPNPTEIPGIVYISRPITLQIGQRIAQSEVAILLEPPDSECTNMTVTFQWRIDHRRADVTYCADLFIDQGRDALASPLAQRFSAGPATALQLAVAPPRQDPALLQWGIRVIACTTVGAVCEERDPPCQGRVLQSDVRRFRLSAQAPHCP